MTPPVAVAPPAPAGASQTPAPPGDSPPSGPAPSGPPFGEILDSARTAAAEGHRQTGGEAGATTRSVTSPRPAPARTREVSSGAAGSERASSGSALIVAALSVPAGATPAAKPVTHGTGQATTGVTAAKLTASITPAGRDVSGAGAAPGVSSAAAARDVSGTAAGLDVSRAAAAPAVPARGRGAAQLTPGSSSAASPAAGPAAPTADAAPGNAAASAARAGGTPGSDTPPEGSAATPAVPPLGGAYAQPTGARPRADQSAPANRPQRTTELGQAASNAAVGAPATRANATAAGPATTTAGSGQATGQSAAPTALAAQGAGAQGAGAQAGGGSHAGPDPHGSGAAGAQHPGGAAAGGTSGAQQAMLAPASDSAGAPVRALTQRLPAAPVRTSVTLQEAVDAVRASFTAVNHAGVSAARISLSPASLGGITISLSQTPDGLIARVQAEHPEAAQTLQQSADELRHSLEAGGMPLLRLEIGSSGHPGPGGFQGSAREGSGGGARGSATPSATTTATDQSATPTELTVKLASGSLVNVLA